MIKVLLPRSLTIKTQNCSFTTSSLNSQLSLNKMKTNQKIIIICIFMILNSVSNP